MSAAYPVHIISPSGLQVRVNANRSIRRMDYHDILLNLFLGNEIEGGPSNIYLRRHEASIVATPILGPHSPTVFRFNDLLTPEQARMHVSYIHQYLLGPDGARLFDRLPPYRGGPQTYKSRVSWRAARCRSAIASALPVTAPPP